MRAPVQSASTRLAVIALIFNALVWGTSWWPLRQLQQQGLHPLWATVVVFIVAVMVISLRYPASWGELRRAPMLWLLLLAAGLTNACFNWAVTVGDVVRVVLLFYLMPVWAVLLARGLLKEPLTGWAALRITMALAGAALVLWPEKGLLPLPQNFPEWLAVLGGFCFALNNVVVRHQAHQSPASQALAMCLGGAVVPGALAVVFSQQGTIPALPALAWPWLLGALSMGTLFLVANLALQYGAARLPANVTAVAMVTEVLFASASAVALGAGLLSWPLVLGGCLIVGATLLGSRK